MGLATDTKREHKRSTNNRRQRDAAELEFEKLYLESYGLVYNYVRYRMSGDNAVEDVVSEAYLKAARAFHTFDPSRAKFSSWVIKIAINCMNSYYRKARPTAPLEDVSERTLAASGGQDAVDDKDLALRLLALLDDEERNLIAMKYNEGKRNVDIAQELNMNASTVSTKLANALAKMRAAVEKEL